MTIEPLWWTDARALRERGLSFAVIGRLLHRNPTSVIYAVAGEDWRARKKEKFRVRNADKAHLSERKPWPRVRNKIMVAAHYEAAQCGLHVDMVLIAWGQPARREMLSRRAGA